MAWGDNVVQISLSLNYHLICLDVQGSVKNLANKLFPFIDNSHLSCFISILPTLVSLLMISLFQVFVFLVYILHFWIFIYLQYEPVVFFYFPSWVSIYIHTQLMTSIFSVILVKWCGENYWCDRDSNPCCWDWKPCH